MSRRILQPLCMAISMSGFWPLYLGIAAAHSGSGPAIYGLLLVLAIALLVGPWLLFTRLAGWPR
jgi:hypothetical protein